LKQLNLQKRWRPLERLMVGLLFLCAVITVVTTAGIIWVLFSEAFAFFREVSLFDFLTDSQWTPLFADKHFGILPLATATVLAAAIAVLVAGPLGLLAAVWLAEYAPGRARRIIKPILEVLAGIPTVVYGYFALFFVTPLLRSFVPGLEIFNVLSPGIVMGVMILPMIASLSQDAMMAVPSSLRQGSYALGATRMETSRRVVLPAAFSGIVAAFILAISRAIGETMIVAIAMGQQPVLSLNPLRAQETMTAFIVQVSLGDVPHGSLGYQTIFAVGLALFLMTFALNLASYFVLRRFREVYE
jgi:phosphate transport system permease protein